MNISNFIKQVPSDIYHRGKDYYENGNVSDLQNLDNGRWIAEVEGNYDDYNVEITLDDQGNIKDFECDCPYEGDICKHVVAVLLEINDQLDMQEIEDFDNSKTTSEIGLKETDPSQTSVKTDETIPEWQVILRDISEQELREYIINYANHSVEFQDELVINFSKAQKKINTEKYRQIISHTFDIMSDRFGFIEFRDVDAAMVPVESLLEKADDYLSENHLHEAFSIVSAVAIECLNTVQNMDDSNGSCGGAISISFSLVDKILENCSDTQLSDDIFDWLSEQVNNEDYYNYGCGEVLESTFLEWANNPSRLDKAYRFIDQKIKILENEKKLYNNYRLTELLKYKQNLLTKNGEKEKAEQIINDYLYLNDFRQLKIDEALAKNDYKNAIEHIYQGIQQAEKENHPGTMYRYKTQLFKIYTKQNDQKNIRKIAKELYFDGRHSLENYLIYKNTFSTEEWENERDKIISSFTKQQKNYTWGYLFNSDLAEIYIEEQMWKPLLDEVIKADRIDITDSYRQYLQNQYSQELLILYYNNILKYSENTGREIYAHIVSYLKNMAKLDGGLKEAKELMLKLLEMYRNRPAMKDEFRLLNW
jgi:hypothetical protein